MEPFGELYDRRHWIIAALRNRSKTSARPGPFVQQSLAVLAIL